MFTNQIGYIKFVIILLVLPLLALVFLKPPLTPNPKVDYGSCSGSLAANKSFRFDFSSNGLRSPDNQSIQSPNASTSAPYGIVQFNNTVEGTDIVGSTTPDSIKCDGNNCRFIDLAPNSINASAPYQQINNQVFRLFKEDNLIPKAIFPWHLGWIGQVTLPDAPSKKRNVWIVLSDCHGNRRSNVTDSLCALGTDIKGENISGDPNYDPTKSPAAAGWLDPTISDSTQPAFFLLYVQKDTPEAFTNSFLNFDLYYKVGTNGELDLTKDLPKFIQNFCKNSEPITPLSVVQVGPQSYDPPKELTLTTNSQQSYVQFPRTAQSKPLECPGLPLAQSRFPDLSQKFKLMLYTKFGGTVTGQQGTGTAANPQSTFCGMYTLKNSVIQNNSSDSDYYVGIVSLAGFLTLTDTKLQYTYYYLPDNSNSQNTTPSPSPRPNKNLQLTTFNLDQVLPWGWWIPECKPAIYLYPETSQQIAVKVTPKGHLTYTDPPYPIPEGWNITAHPNGTIESQNKTYPYLYYESKIRDEWIDKPLAGFVTSREGLTTTLNRILPKLGLNKNETHDFIEYWVKALPNAPYYYLGVLSPEAIDKIEPLEVSPTPDTNIRVRIYFQALSAPISIPEPKLDLPPTRKGFSLVEWGGLVKNDPNHPFTCSQ